MDEIRAKAVAKIQKLLDSNILSFEVVPQMKELSIAVEPPTYTLLADSFFNVLFRDKTPTWYLESEGGLVLRLRVYEEENALTRTTEMIVVPAGSAGSTAKDPGVLMEDFRKWVKFNFNKWHCQLKGEPDMLGGSKK